MKYEYDHNEFMQKCFANQPPIINYFLVQESWNEELTAKFENLKKLVEKDQKIILSVLENSKDIEGLHYIQRIHP